MRVVPFAALASLLAPVAPALAQEPPPKPAATLPQGAANAPPPTATLPRQELELETGAVGQGRNVARIPGDTGTYFDLRRLIGGGADPFVRLTYVRQARPGQQIRLVYAPLLLSGSGVLPTDTRFAGATFPAGVPTRATYRFNAPRVTYRWQIAGNARHRLHLGVTALIRDAAIGLEQAGLSRRDTDLGFVPLLHVAGERALGLRWRVLYDLDGLAAPQGRALDLGVRAVYQLDRNWHIGAGYRTLEGGADNDRVFNFAYLNYATVAVGCRF